MNILPISSWIQLAWVVVLLEVLVGIVQIIRYRRSGHFLVPTLIVSASVLMLDRIATGPLFGAAQVGLLGNGILIRLISDGAKLIYFSVIGPLILFIDSRQRLGRS